MNETGMEAHSGALTLIGVPVSTQVTKRAAKGAIHQIGGWLAKVGVPAGALGGTGMAYVNLQHIVWYASPTPYGTHQP